MERMSLEAYKRLNCPKAKQKAKSKQQARKLAELVKLNLRELPGYEQEYIFHPTRKWRFDYSWPELKVALEIHGGVFSNGRHTRGVGFSEDKVKMNSAQLLGWLVIEATTTQVKSGQMLDWITTAIELRGNNAPD